MRLLTLITLGCIISLSSCQENKNRQTENPNTDSTLTETPKDSSTNIQTDSTLIVRENFNRINAIKNWDRIDSAEIHESTEGGIAKYYTKNNVLELIKARHYGESGYTYQDIYLKDGKLSFVFEERFDYNTHIIDPKFDMDKTKKAGEVRYYYMDDKLFNIIATDKENEKFLKEYKDTDKNLKDVFNKLIKIKENNFDPTGISD